MKISNKTGYSTRHLRKIFLACEKNEGTDHGHRNVEVIYGRKKSVSGYAWYNSNKVVMKLPKPEFLTKIHQLAQVYIHEVGHNLNLRHREMMKWWNIPVEFLEEGNLEVKTQKTQKTKKSVVEINEEKARKKLAEWGKKLNRAKTFVKKYQKKVTYYDKKKEKATV